MSRCLAAILGLLFALTVYAEVRESCGDGSFCPSGTTCCDIGSGEYGCCPIPDAVCCSDKLHCCPQGMTCDTTHSMCTNGYIRQPFHQKMKTERQVGSDSWESNSIEDEEVENGSEECKDHKSRCPEHTTCCSAKGKTTGCCPMEDAVCCTDGLHCCPPDHTCNLEEETCEPTTGNEISKSKPWYKSLASTRIVRKKGVKYQPSLQECSNGDTCNGQSTCCYNADDNEAYCCAYANGKCCRNGKKCCSEGFSCSEYGDECVREENGVSISMRMIQTKIAKGVEGESNEQPDQKCPDGTRCSPLNTCCPIRSHLDGGIIGYQCCELTNGVCCNDHCCPRGHRCSTDGRCEKSVLNKPVNWFN
ncbi:Granulin [Aphelenchoides besseyi]|nr:Granulin [Aphelenchoides besseyi]KAI6225856.1 Granulin [Aphelenchoides besseyi]